MKYEKGQLMINQQPYKKKVEPPKPTDVLKLQVSKVAEILMLKVARGEHFKQDGSTFVEYIAVVKTHQQVKDLYMHL